MFPLSSVESPHLSAALISMRAEESTGRSFVTSALPCRVTCRKEPKTEELSWRSTEPS